MTTADDHSAYAATGSGGQIEVVPDLGLVVVIASADETGAAEATAYLDLVADCIAPGVGR